MKKVSLFLASLALSLPIVGAAYQWQHNRREALRYQPVGRRFDIGGYRLHLHATGHSHTGVPSVVLDAGSGGTYLSWYKVQPAISSLTRVCSFDRAGMGWSDIGPQPRTSQRIADELHTLLHAAAIPAPYLLVGHSFGGMNMRVFAATYPQEVAGLVLVDAPNEAEIECLPDSPPIILKQHIRRAVWYLAALFGLVRLALRVGLIAQDMSNYPANLHALANWLYAQPKAVKTRDDEDLVAKTSCAQVRATRPYLTNLPIIVISSGQKGVDSPLMDYQRELAALTTQGQHIVATGSGHLVQFDRPDLVIEVIKQCLLQQNTLPLQQENPVLPEIDNHKLDIQYT